MNFPLVSVICLCYNQGRFVTEAIESVIKQTYTNLQIIIVDDASADNSVAEIQKVVDKNPFIEFIALDKNHGNCKAFNIGWSRAKGDFIIDFACDDIMLPDRIKRQVEFFQALDADYGVIFTDAVYVNEERKFLYNHIENLRHKKLLTHVPQGDVYTELISTYFISSPTMMVRREVLESLHGYDETLAYEDFDFWIRSSRLYKYAFLDEKLTLVRKSNASMSTGWYKPGDPQLHSTYLICLKIRQLNRNVEENESLIKRVRYELRQSVFSSNRKEAKLFFELLAELNDVNLMDRIIYWLGKISFPLAYVHKTFQR
ncbi:MAG TPA: glycosyltransferase [Cyclobacteriaceae bacterium]